ncbi:hypothetical protein PHLCEN_2v2745 [Hermanssonia centrifuga]|uniref:Uncharacterized protein n=1 Tax=Hermanssonia centrifuga TaxID=98765 RepID=A0A2R6RHV3_9APHY|nr:hypothetical protein PHLCEN_2v2745 [Hermanssonia centrifuga]
MKRDNLGQSRQMGGTLGHACASVSTLCRDGKKANSNQGVTTNRDQSLPYLGGACTWPDEEDHEWNNV